MADFRTDTENILEHLVVPENKGMLQKQKTKPPYIDGAFQRGTGAN